MSGCFGLSIGNKGRKMSLQRVLGWWSSSADSTLKGHRLLIITPAPPEAEWLDRVKKSHPKLEVVYYERNSWDDPLPPKDIEWDKVTLLLTGILFPTVEQAPNLKLIQLQSAGANFVLDSPIFKDTDIAFSTANGVHGPQITEWVITTFLASQHHIPKYLDYQREGKWQRITDVGVQDAVGARVGILGYGSIGRQVARVAKALGSDVVAYTNGRKKTPESRRDDGYIVPGTGDPEGVFPSKWYSSADNEFEEFLSSGLDLLVVAVPLTPATKDLISVPEFKLLSKNKTFLSNIARGPVVNTDALIEALDNELIRGAALDVTDPEPLPEGHPLWKAPNLIITPHISSNSYSYNKRVFEILELNLQRLGEGKDFVNKVNKREGY